VESVVVNLSAPPEETRLIGTFDCAIIQSPPKLQDLAMAIEFELNGESVSLDVDPAMPLLWAIRDIAGLTGTKYGCGIALCGTCTVHINGQPMRSCVLPASVAEGAKVTTIEGLSKDGNHPVQAAWRELNVAQCGYCQSGQIMTAVGLLERIPNPTDADIDEAMSGNICRCGTYTRIRKAIHRAAGDKS
jgi:isoquinoline 1-oxidoreductase alpha subunit